MMKFKAKNLNWLKPTWIAFAVVVLALLQAFDVVGVFSYALFSAGMLTISVGTLLMLVLAVGVLMDARR